MTTDGTRGDSSRSTKVDRLIAEYELTGLGDQLERYWTGEADTRYSLRELADLFNQRLLRRAMEDADRAPLEEEVETVYQLLTGADTSKASETRVRRDLERDGVDVSSLESDFVSHQAIHTYLTKERGAEFEERTADPRESVRQTVQQLQSRLRAVTETGLDRLGRAGEVDVDSSTVLVDVRVYCDSCGQTLTIEELLAAGGCECGAD